LAEPHVLLLVGEFGGKRDREREKRSQEEEKQKGKAKAFLSFLLRFFLFFFSALFFPFSPTVEYRSARLSAIHFQGRFIRQVSCYALLSGFQLPWPPSCCLNEPTPFVVSGMSVHSGTATQRLVDPTSPVLLTKNGPLRTLSIRKLLFEKNNCAQVHSQSL